MKATRSSWHQWVLAVTAIAAIGGSGAVAARAQQGPGAAGPCARPEGFLTHGDREAIGKVVRERIKEKVGLSDEQADQIRAVLQSRRDESRADVQALCEARVELRRLLGQQNSDPAALKAAADRVKSLQGKLLDRRLDTMIAVRSQLTADQWAKWIELRKGMGHRWMGRGRGLAS